MTAVVFAGPTIIRDDIMSICDCRCLPPAARGDVYRASLAKPTAIGIIDGYFQGVLSVWHKEILWAISQGIHVFGSSSMGALRAAELQAYGMVGVGRIFEDFVCGRLEDDDEVAVLHGPAEMGFPALSEPMVNIRATIESAVDQSIIDCDSGDALQASAKRLHFHDRNWKALLDTAAGSVAAGQIEALQAWLPTGQVDVKRDDAVKMLTTLQEFVSSDPAPKEPGFAFEWTYQWDMVTREVVDEPAFVPRGANDVSYEDLLDELRVDPDVYARLSELALLRLLAQNESSAGVQGLDRSALKSRMHRFRVENGLMTKRALDAWLETNRLDAHGLDRLHEQDARIKTLCEEAGRELEPHILAALRSSGEFAAFHARAAAKKAALEDAGRTEVRPSDLGMKDFELVAWYFEIHLDQEIPHDLNSYITQLGFPDIDYFHRFLTREFLYAAHS